MILKDIKFLVTQNPSREIKKDIDLRIDGDTIKEIGEIESDEEERVIECSKSLVMPGLINAHTHASMSLLRGISDNKKLMEWLEEDIFPAEEKMDAEDIRTGALLAATEMLETGTTCFNDMYEKPDQIAQAVEETGIRSVLSRAVFDWDENGEKRVQKAKETVRKYEDHPLIQPSIAPHAVYSCETETLKEVKDFAEEHRVPYHIHVSETRSENEDHMEEYGKTPTEYLEEHGLLDSTVIAAHSTWLTDKDRKLFAEAQANVAHNPGANLKLGSGIADIPQLMEEGINVSLGTDGPASNNNFNMFEEMKLATLIHKRKNPETVTPQDVLDMATVNGAKALGMEKQIGSVQKGKKADLLILDTQQTEIKPHYGKQGIISNLVLSHTGHPEKVLVNGEVVAEKGEATGIKREKILEKAQKKTQKFAEASENN